MRTLNELNQMLDVIAEAKAALSENRVLRLESKFRDKWNDKWLEVTNPSWDFFKYNYRVKPESHNADLEAKDIKPGTWVRKYNDPTEARLITGIKVGYVEVGLYSFTYKELRAGYLRTADLKTWTPCEKEV